jgi:endonuclease YncB( thermonuclease family)
MGMTHHLSYAALTSRRRGGGVLAMAGAIFALGFAAGAAIGPVAPRSVPSVAAALAETRGDEPPSAARLNASRADPQHAYPADIVRIIDGDTFEARVRVWPGLEVDTKVRLRNVDAPELHARCAGEFAKAQAARAALQTMLAAGGVTLSQVGIDKYGGRVDALVATRDTADVSVALLNGGFARSYDGGRRGSWC